MTREIRGKENCFELQFVLIVKVRDGQSDQSTFHT